MQSVIEWNGMEWLVCKHEKNVRNTYFNGAKQMNIELQTILLEYIYGFVCVCVCMFKCW